MAETTNRATVSHAICELEAATDFLMAADTADLEQLSIALARRHEAVARVAAALKVTFHAEDLSRAKAASLRGEEVARKLSAMKQDAAAELCYVSQIARASRRSPQLSAHAIDYSF